MQQGCGVLPVTKRQVLQGLITTSAVLGFRVQAQAAPPFRSGLAWRSGFRIPRNKYALINPVGGNGEYQQIEQWRGRPIDVVDQFIGPDLADSWSEMVVNYVLGGTSAEPVGTLAATYDAGFTPSLAIPLVIKSEARRFDLVASGKFDAYHHAVAQRIATIAAGRLIYLRLGWECNEGYPWSWIDIDSGQSIPDTRQWQTRYRHGWRRIALIYKKEVVGAKLVWNHLKNTRRNTTLYYPGDDAVDVLGMDLYDTLDGTAVTSEAVWVNYAGIYNGLRFTGPGGMVKFAAERGKTVSFCEWAPYNKSRTIADPANQPYFVRRLFQFFSDTAAAGRMEYECYFQTSTTGGPQLIWPNAPYNPLPQQSYLENW